MYRLPDRVPLHFRETSRIPIPNIYDYRDEVINKAIRIFNANITRNEYIDREKDYEVNTKPFDVKIPNHIRYISIVNRILNKIDDQQNLEDITTPTEQDILRAFSESNLQEYRPFTVYVPVLECVIQDVEAEIILQYHNDILPNNKWLRYTIYGETFRAFWYTFETKGVPL